MRAMILAAGRGERMRPLTDRCPKPLLPAAGKPLIEYHLERLSALGVREVVINHAWLGGQFEPSLGRGERWNLNIQYSAEETALETAGGVLNALPMLGSEPFLLINGDVYCEYDLSKLRLEAADLACLLLIPNPEHHTQGDFCLNDAGRVVEKVAGERAWTFAGISLMRPELFENLPAGHGRLLPVLQRAMAQQALSGQLCEDYWCDVGTPERLQALELHLAESCRRIG